jgi:hypothetical protein
MSGCADNHKNFFLEESIHFVNAGGPVLNEMRDYVEKSYSCVPLSFNKLNLKKILRFSFDSPS